MRFRVFIANLLFIVCCMPEWIKFNIFIFEAQHMQFYILKKIIKNNENSGYGKKYKFSEIINYNDWKKNVPVISYEDIAPYVYPNGEFLTQNKIKLYEPTSGSSGLQKLIPYTEELRKEFQKGIKVWIFDLYLKNPELLFYKSYWSISPKTKTESTKNSKIGFEKDEEYFSEIEQKFLKIIMIQPDIDGDYITKTKEELLKEKNNLGLISIWSPTFLDSVLDNKKIEFKNLKIISCWADAASKVYAQKLQYKYPHTIIQPKGLLSTEGITSFPLSKKGCVISYRSHFYEFVDSNGKVFLLNNLQKGKLYTVILTTSGGLYRYNTHDIIKVTGFYKTIPIVEFIGRDNNVSDFFGEKISEEFVNKIFLDIFKSKQNFAVLSFNQDKYTLYVDGNCSSKVLESFLLKNYHYKNCRELGQLKHCTVIKVSDGLNKYKNYYLSAGMKLGDIKIKALDNKVCDIFNL